MADSQKNALNDSPAPQLSVLVPCYNVAKYLPQCLDSLLSQTLHNLEVICINDGSTDKTPQILQEYAAGDQRIHVINKENSGYGDSMNRGLAAANGKYIAILESDDFIAPTAFEKLVATAEATNVPVVKANFFFYWENPTPRTVLNALIHENTPRIVQPLHYPALFWYMPAIWSAIYRRDFLLENQIHFLPTLGASYQDLSFTFKVWAHAPKVALLPEAFVSYRQDNVNSSINSAGKVFAVAKEFAEITHFITQLPLTPTRAEKLNEYATRLQWDSYLWNYWRLSPAARQDFLPHFRQTFKSAMQNGKVNPKYFFPWSKKDLRRLLYKPASFAKLQSDRYAGRARYFWKILACITENKLNIKKWRTTKKQIKGIWE